MNNFLCKHLFVIASLITLTTHTTFANFRNAVGNLSQRPSAACSHLLIPFQKIGKKAAPHVPEAYASVTLPLASCVLYLISKQVIPEIKKTKSIEFDTTVDTAIKVLNLGLMVASFNKTWTSNVNPDGSLNDPIGWGLNNLVNTSLIGATAYSLYKLSCPANQRAVR